MGIYAESEFDDLYGYRYKVQIVDTTYSGSTNTFTFEKEGFLQSWDGYQDELYFSPINNSSVVVPIYITEDDTAMNNLVSDLRIGKEDQYYVRVYKSDALIWIGKVLIDTIQFEDLVRFRFELNATDGLNRLENFRCDFIDSISGNYITLIDLIRNCVSPCGFDQFYAASEKYISCIATWKETSQTTSGGFLKNTRINKIELVLDDEKGTKKTCKQALTDVLGSFGLSIRFDRGRWFITQPSNFTGTNALAYHYKKNGSFIGTETILVQTVISNDPPNYPLATLMDAYKPNYKEVAVKCIDNSTYRFEKSSFTTSGYDISLLTASKQNDYELKFFLQYAYFSAGSLGQKGKSVLFMTTFRFQCGQYELRLVNGKYKWIIPAPRNVGGVEIRGDGPVRVDDTVTIYGPEVIKLSGTLNIPKLPADAPSNISLGIWVAADGKSRLWTGVFRIKQLGASEIQYSTTNDDINAASVSVDKQVQLSDFANDFSSSPIQIYTGSTWQYSQLWTSDGSDIGGVPVMKLLSQQAMYFQRNPRLLVQGQFNITDGDSLTKMNWRSTSYLFLNGTFTARECIWDGLWLELLSQSTTTTSVSNNPYRGEILRMKGDIDQLKTLLAQTNDKLTGVTEIATTGRFDIDRLISAAQQGPELWLLQNLSGIPNGAADDAEYFLKAQVSADGNKTLKLKFSS